MTYSDALREFVKGWEGPPSLSPHWDAIGKVWDIGWGHVIHQDEERRDITRDEAEMLMDWDLHSFDDGVSAAIVVPVAQCEYDACVSLSYNIGLAAFSGSTLLRRLNAEDKSGAAEQFAVWNRSGGAVVNGLIRRRAAERAIFERGDYTGRP